jgi:hypothetical protein
MEPDGNAKKADGSVALVQFDRPGTLILNVTTTGMPEASSGDPCVKLREVSWKEFVTTAEGIGFGAAIVWLDRARFLIFPVLQISCVFFLRNFAERCLLRLPLAARGHARREIRMLLWIAQWAGFTCCAIWTIRDILEFALRPI